MWAHLKEVPRVQIQREKRLLLTLWPVTLLRKGTLGNSSCFLCTWTKPFRFSAFLPLMLHLTFLSGPLGHSSNAHRLSSSHVLGPFLAQSLLRGLSSRRNGLSSFCGCFPRSLYPKRGAEQARSMGSLVYALDLSLLTHLFTAAWQEEEMKGQGGYEIYGQSCSCSWTRNLPQLTCWWHDLCVERRLERKKMKYHSMSILYKF